ncbi:Maleylacetate reductase [compost metagenome]
MARIARALGVDNAAQGLFDLAASNGAPIRLADIGMKEVDLARAVEIACSSPYWNPRPIEPVAIRKLLENAFNGTRP